jgi:hypothetical protein
MSAKMDLLQKKFENLTKDIRNNLQAFQEKNVSKPLKSHVSEKSKLVTQFQSDINQVNKSFNPDKPEDISNLL